MVVGIAVAVAVLIVVASAVIVAQAARRPAVRRGMPWTGLKELRERLRGKLSAAEIDVLVHTLGLDLAPVSYRNHYVRSAAQEESAELRRLVSMGWMGFHSRHDGSRCYWVTNAGRRAMGVGTAGPARFLSAVSLLSLAVGFPWADGAALLAQQVAPFAWVYGIGPDGTCGQIPANHQAARTWRIVPSCGPASSGPAVADPGQPGQAIADHGGQPWAGNAENAVAS